MFERFLDSVEKTGDITLRYYFQKEMMKNDILNREEREKLKAEIIDEIMPRIGVKLNDEALKQLSEMLRNLGK